MQGTLLCGLREFVAAEYGEETWDAVVSSAALEDQLFVPVTEYPEEYYYDLVETAAEVTGQEAAALEQDFGRSLLAYLLDDDPDQRDAVELLADVDEWAAPAFDGGVCGDGERPLAVQRVEDGQLELTYGCHRGLCRVVRGLVDGVAAATGTALEVTERECIHDGADRCTIVARATPRSPGERERTRGGAPGAID